MTTKNDGVERLRIDKWLWYARFFKSRTRASALCVSGKLRLGGDIVRKAHRTLCVGDILTFPQGRRICVVRVLALAGRRGPVDVAQELYEDLAPDSSPVGATQGFYEKLAPRSSLIGAVLGPRRPQGAGRPTKKDRRAIVRLKGGA
jgi:ribosome-associated heat shock protein Hsp15